MSLNGFPSWDKNRPIFFQIGMIIALAVANYAMEYTHTIPQYNVDALYEINGELNTTPILTHREYVPPKVVVLPPKIDPLVAKIIATPEPILATVATTTESTPNLDNIGVEGSSDIKIIVPPKEIVAPPAEPSTFTITEHMPHFASCADKTTEEDRKMCTQEVMLQYIYKNLKYPNLARETGVEGTVILTFIIDKNGKLINIEAIRDIGAGCGTAAIKALRSLPTWIPGKHNQKNVNVKYTIPIKFRLSI